MTSQPFIPTMNTSREPPGPRYQDPYSPDLSYQNHFRVPSYSPPEYQQDDDYVLRVRHFKQSLNTPLKRMPRVERGRAGRPRDKAKFATQPPPEGIKIKETPRHRVEAGVVERPFSWINTEATTPEVTSLHELEDEAVEVPYMDPMAESPPEEDGMPSRWVQVTDAQYLLLKDFQEFQERQRKTFCQHANEHIRPHGSPESDPIPAFYNSVVARAEGSSGTRCPVHPTSSERRSREPCKSKEPISRNISTTNRNSLRSLAAGMAHLF